MARAKKKAGDSTQGLVITLVFSVIIMLASLVAAYMGFAEQDALREEIARRANKAKLLEADRDWQMFQKLLFLSATGYPLTDEEKNTTLPSLSNRYDTGRLGANLTNKEIADKLIARVKNDLGWDPAKHQFLDNFFDRIKKLQDESKKLRETWQRQVALKETEVARLEKIIQSKDEAIAKYEKEIKALNQKDVVDLKGQTATFLKKVDEELQARANEINEIRKRHAAELADREKQIAKLKKDLEALNNKYQTVLVKVEPVDLLKHDKPKGRIIRLEGSGNLAYIDLGSADNVKPQLSFSVYGQDATGRPKKGKNMPRKAAVEVLDVLKPHLSVARVTDVVDSGRDPVLTGDYLFNPAWSPTLKKHVFIAGIIDLTGDGLDNTPEFIRNLEKQNIIVDGYLDLRDDSLPIRGKMTYQTDFLVLGEMPSLENQGQAMPNDPRNQRLTEIIKKLSEIQNDAGVLGVSIVPARRYLELIGYPLPKVFRKADYNAKTGLNIRYAKPMER
ncbi:MAG: hypothetical protein KatS3mg105_2408 [Gemmatales bacterium]|nr:MAG: hypothetical protein KatS3mg105_2408 [Gemmatales bacterium]